MPIGRVALTGGIATGKSTVRAHLERLGVPTIDADILSREAVAPGSDGLRDVACRFGPSVIDAGGGLDRKVLGRLVFTDPEARQALEAIVHPRVRAATEAWFAALDDTRHPFAVADIPLLYEVGRERDFDAVIVAACPPEVQLTRLMARDGLSEAEARARIAAQWPLDEKVTRADYVIDTAGTHQDTARQTEAVFQALTRRRWNQAT